MGGAASTPGETEKETQKICRATGLSKDEVKFLAKRYAALLKTPGGKLGLSDLPDFGSEILNSFVRKIFRSLPLDGKEQASFPVFCQGAALFVPSVPLEERLSNLFNILDTDQDDIIDEDDVDQLMKLLHPEKTAEELKQLRINFYKEVIPEQPEADSIARDEFVYYAKDVPNINEMVCLDLSGFIAKMKEEEESRTANANNVNNNDNNNDNVNNNDAAAAGGGTNPPASEGQRL